MRCASHRRIWVIKVITIKFKMNNKYLIATSQKSIPLVKIAQPHHIAISYSERGGAASELWHDSFIANEG